MKSIYDNAVVRRWEDIPFEWRLVDVPSKVKIKSFDPKEKDFTKVFSVFASDDTLRPAMTGVNFDDKGICITDAHKMVFIPKSKYQSYFPKEQGIFEFGSGRKIDERYPNYEAVIPKNNSEVSKIDVVKLLTYCNMILKGQYCNQTSFQCSFVYGKEKPKTIGFNLKFLKTILEFWLRMGFDKLYLSIEQPNRAALFSPYENGVKGDDILDYPVTLLMPVMLGEEYFGATDIDYDRESLVHYVFSEDEIYDVGEKIEDVKPVKFDYNLVDYVNPDYTKEEIKLWSKMVNNSKNYIPALSCVKIKDAKATVSNLDVYISKYVVNIPDGLYYVINGSLSNSKNDIDDFPSINNTQTKSFVKDGAFNFDEFKYQFENAVKCVSKDALRPTLSTVHIQEELIEATDTYLLYRQNLKSWVKDLDISIVSPLWLSQIMEVVEATNSNQQGVIKVVVYSKDANSKPDYIEFIFDKHSAIFKNEDGKYPNTKSVIPIGGYAKNLTIENSTELTNVLKGLTKEEIKNDILISFNTKTSNTEILAFNRSENQIRELGAVNSFYRDENFVSEVGLFAMPNDRGGENYDFTYLYSILKRATVICGNGAMKIYYNEPNKLTLIQNKDNFEFVQNESTKKVKKKEPIPTKTLNAEEAAREEILRFRARARIRVLALSSKS